MAHHNHHNQYHIFTSILSQLYHLSYLIITSLVLSLLYLHSHTSTTANCSCCTHVILLIIPTQLCPQSMLLHLYLYSITTVTLPPSFTHTVSPDTYHHHHSLPSPSPYHHYVSHPVCSPTVATITVWGSNAAHCHSYTPGITHSHLHFHGLVILIMLSRSMIVSSHLCYRLCYQSCHLSPHRLYYRLHLHGYISLNALGEAKNCKAL